MRRASHAFPGRALAALAAALMLAAAGPPEAPVADAAMRGDAAAVRALLEQGADPNEAQGDGMTALHWAAERGDAQLASALLAAGARPDAVTRLGAYTPLHLAARGAHTEVVRALLEHGATPSAPTSTGAATPLHFAALAASPDAARALLEHGADPDARETEWGQTPLMFAAASGRSATIAALLEYGADPNAMAWVLDMSKRAEEDALDQRKQEEARAAGVAPNAPRGVAMTPPKPVDRERNRPMPAEPEPRSWSEAELIGGYGGLTPLLMAVREGQAEAALELLDAGADLELASGGDGTTPLVMATINGHFDLALALIERGANVHARNDSGAGVLYTTLNTQWIPKARHPHAADYMQQRSTYMDVLRAALDRGADPNVRLVKQLWFTSWGGDYLGVDRMGATPFWRAAYALDIDAMKLLVDHGADPNIPTMKPPERRRRGGGGEEGPDPSGLPPVPDGGPGVYPIHAAAGVGYGEGFAANIHRHVPEGWMPAMRYLVEEIGADVGVRDYNGYNVIHHAAARGDNEMILYLVEKGADPLAVSRRGQTTVDMANGPVQRISPFPETIRLLESMGAKNNHNCQSC